MIRLGLKGAIAAALVIPAWAIGAEDRQTTPAPVTQASAPTPRTIEEAEAEGAKHAQVTVAQEPEGFADAFGPKGRKCVEAADHTAIRSGDFVAGSFNPRYMMVGTNGQPAKWKIWWIPKYVNWENTLLRLRAAKLGAPEKTYSTTFVATAYSVNPDTRERGKDPFYPSTVLFPENGKWLVVMTASNNWGCFIVEETQAK